MSARVEAAADAVMHAAFGQELPEAPIDLAQAALAASDSVMFSEAAIERAAKALQGPWSSRPWDQLSEDSKDIYRADVRAVVAALREEK